MARADKLFKRLTAARLDNTLEAEYRRLAAVELLIIDDFALQPLTPAQTTDFYEIITERHRRASTVVTSNRDASEWLPLMTDPLLAQSAIDRLTSTCHELIVEGDSYRRRQRPPHPRLTTPPHPHHDAHVTGQVVPRSRRTLAPSSWRMTEEQRIQDQALILPARPSQVFQRRRQAARVAIPARRQAASVHVDNYPCSARHEQQARHTPSLATAVQHAAKPHKYWRKNVVSTAQDRYLPVRKRSAVQAITTHLIARANRLTAPSRALPRSDLL